MEIDGIGGKATLTIEDGLYHLVVGDVDDTFEHIRDAWDWLESRIVPSLNRFYDTKDSQIYVRGDSAAVYDREGDLDDYLQFADTPSLVAWLLERETQR